MQRRNATRMRVFLRGFVLALISLVALAPVHAQTESSEPPNISSQHDALSVSSSDSLMLTVHVELSVTHDVGAVFEDSDEMLRVDIEQRAIGIDRETIELKVLPKTVRNLRPTISPPLLV
jgi:hypothetical protein